MRERENYGDFSITNYQGIIARELGKFDFVKKGQNSQSTLTDTVEVHQLTEQNDTILIPHKTESGINYVDANNNCRLFIDSNNKLSFNSFDGIEIETEEEYDTETTYTPVDSAKIKISLGKDKYFIIFGDTFEKPIRSENNHSRRIDDKEWGYGWISIIYRDKTQNPSINKRIVLNQRSIYADTYIETHNNYYDRFINAFNCNAKTYMKYFEEFIRGILNIYQNDEHPIDPQIINFAATALFCANIYAIDLSNSYKNKSKDVHNQMKTWEYEELWQNTKNTVKFVNKSNEQIIGELKDFRDRITQSFHKLIVVSHKRKVLDALERKKQKVVEKPEVFVDVKTYKKRLRKSA